MSLPSPESPLPQKPQKPPIILPTGMTLREKILAATIVLALLGFLFGAIYTTGTEKPHNLLQGIVRAHHSTSERVREISLAYRNGKMQGRTVDTGYSLTVFVEKENRTYEVMVEKSLWGKIKIGDPLEFLRPPAEQQ